MSSPGCRGHGFPHLVVGAVAGGDRDPAGNVVVRVGFRRLAIRRVGVAVAADIAGCGLRVLGHPGAGRRASLEAS